MKNEKTKKTVLILLCLTAFILLLLIPQTRSYFMNLLALFKTGDFTVIRDFTASYGAYAACVSFLLMIFQSIAAPLPAFLITFANANLFGFIRGALLSFWSAMAGAAVCFFIARYLGRDITEKLATKAGLKEIDAFFERYGKNAVLICRLLPFVSFDLVSYAAGLTSMSFGGFIIATGIGQLPATIVYSYVGGMLTGGAKIMVTGLLILFAVFSLILLFKKIYEDKHKK